MLTNRFLWIPCGPWGMQYWPQYGCQHFWQYIPPNINFVPSIVDPQGCKWSRLEALDLPFLMVCFGALEVEIWWHAWRHLSDGVFMAAFFRCISPISCAPLQLFSCLFLHWIVLPRRSLVSPDGPQGVLYWSLHACRLFDLVVFSYSGSPPLIFGPPRCVWSRFEALE